MSLIDSQALPNTPDTEAPLRNSLRNPPRNPLRLWPAIVIIAVQWAIALAPGLLGLPMSVAFPAMMFAPMIGLGGLVAWWLLFSGIAWRDRLLGIGVFFALGAVAVAVSRTTFPLVGVLFYALPAMTSIWVLWLVISIPLAWPVRRAGLLMLFVAAWVTTMVLRIDGMTGEFKTAFNWRWAETSEDRLRAELATKKQPVTSVSAVKETSKEALTLGDGDWPGFRGPQRDSRLTGVKIAANFSDRPPKLIWRHRVGPGWGSFALVGNRLFTQEQRGDQGEKEAVICYSADTGESLWIHTDDSRFAEIMAGPGPRATPTFDSGRIYALGANGALNCLDAASGAVIWTHDVVADSGAKVPQWGFSASPLVADGVVTVFAGGPSGKSVLGYRADDGKLAWSAGDGQNSYCSTQLSKLGGVEQLLIATGDGVSAFEPATGKQLWDHHWPMSGGMARVVQPAVLDDSSLLVGTGFDYGTRKLAIKHDGDKWTATEAWTSRDIKPYYNDLVVHDGNLYGFDNSFFTCVGLKDGKRKWKVRDYGSGQVLLLADQDLLLVVSETGELALLEATPKQHKELCRFQAIQGKTWNHPVIGHGRVFLRNGEEAACYELTPAAGA